MDFLKFYNFLQNELEIYYDFNRIKNKKIAELDLTSAEIDLFLNKLEFSCQKEVHEGSITPDSRFGDMVLEIFSQINEDDEQRERVNSPKAFCI